MPSLSPYNFRTKSVIAIGLVLFLFFSCKEDSPVALSYPDTHLSVEKIELSGADRLNSSVRLSWYGTDRDGLVVAYEFSTDEVNWSRTTQRDSVFKFSIEAGQDSTDIDFYVRAIDNDDLIDQTPAYLSIPLKNSPPSVTFEEESFPGDTSFGVVTFRWSYDDPDGVSTVTNAYLRINEGTWYEIDRSVPMISLRTSNSKSLGQVDADVFYRTTLSKEDLAIDGWNNNGENVFYLKVVDLAGTESILDTSSAVFNKRQTSDLLLINGQPGNVNEEYRKLISKVYPKGFDAIDFAENGGENQPVFWNPTFSLLTELYDKLIFNTDQSLFANRLTSQSALLLEFAAPVMQNFTDGGGKSFVTTSFPAGFDPIDIRGAFPVDSLSGTSGQAVIETDSSIYPMDGSYPNLQPQNLVLGVDPFIPTIDAKPFYKGQLKSFGAWKGNDVVGAIREENGKTKQVFFSVELYRFNKDPQQLLMLFDRILNTEFNW